MNIDIHAYIKYENKQYNISEVLEDMSKNNIDYRVVSSINNLSNIENIKNIINIVKGNDKLIGCALINPKDQTVFEAIKLAVESPYIKMFEFNSFEHGYYPDLQENMYEILKLIETKENPIVKVFSGIGARAIPHQYEKWVKKFKKIKFIFLHMGCFDYGYSCVDIVKRNENAYIESSNQYELQILKKSLDNIEIGRILFGTMYPNRYTSVGLRIFDMFDLEQEKKDYIFYKNALGLLKL